MSSGDQDASSQFIGEEYALASGPRNVIRDAIMKDLKRTNPAALEFRRKSMRARRASCAYLGDNLKPIVAEYLDKINDWAFDVLEMREKKVTESPLLVITMAAMSVSECSQHPCCIRTMRKYGLNIYLLTFLFRVKDLWKDL